MLVLPAVRHWVSSIWRPPQPCAGRWNFCAPLAHLQRLHRLFAGQRLGDLTGHGTRRLDTREQTGILSRVAGTAQPQSISRLVNYPSPPIFCWATTRRQPTTRTATYHMLSIMSEPDFRTCVRTWLVMSCPTMSRTGAQELPRCSRWPGGVHQGLLNVSPRCSGDGRQLPGLAFYVLNSNHGACGDVPQAGGITFHFLFYLAFHQNLTIKLLRSIWHSIWHSVRARRSPDLTIERLFRTGCWGSCLPFGGDIYPFYIVRTDKSFQHRWKWSMLILFSEKNGSTLRIGVEASSHSSSSTSSSSS